MNPDRRHLISVAAVAAVWPALPRVTLAQPPAPSFPDFADLMPTFWAAYDAGRTLAPVPRTQQLMERFFKPNAAVYKRAGMTVTAQRVQDWLPKFDPLAADVRTLHGEFPGVYARQQGRFKRALADFDATISPVSLLPSLFNFDAHLESQGPGKPLPLFFGADGIVRYHGAGTDLAVLFAHELFHCYHAQRSPMLSLDEHPRVHEALWMEGLATYASEQLTPGASLLSLLLDDKALAAVEPAALRAAALALLQDWDNTQDAVLKPFFDMGYKGDWPARIGYYLGLQAARSLGQRHGLREMAGWDRGQLSQRLRPVVEALSASAS